MKSTRVVRKVDKLGRVVIPKELRNTLELPEGTRLEIYIDGEQIIFKKYALSCAFVDRLSV
ncbi:transition state regulatory protein AbrB [Gottschalkia acidurici 9a]|uniref:Transition state regulatory protein AbrB n=1 Tax=Gottschalkia acidurici (strain ATCC 7906 / DSM 604 / BCRC 14475 / CIP 104303 / KCTC 5404 / NCIMB 10678 / 9a) TaxID=1128398 RepID=K0B1E6_GOTA9|nr:AbrB/MazE/SpoVT family DNA-binding domain-containing protein [Gottschalkia acidurici]AFS78486.1 transition state regulatory protein AbrB [Gottschalkia acidurici 9a]